jgi:hypothetical protein
MTARTRLAGGSLLAALALTSAGCLSFYEVTIDTPIRAKLDISPFQRVLVAGFLSGGTKNIDANSETARLLRSQLRTKSDLKVIDSDPIELVTEVNKRRTDAPAGAGQAEATAGIKDERDLQEYEAILKDEAY